MYRKEEEMTTEQKRKLLEDAAPSLLAACKAVFKAWCEKEKEAAKRLCMDAITEATMPPDMQPLEPEK